MTKLKRASYIINAIKEERIFDSMKPICINTTEDDVNIAMVNKNTGMIQYILRFNVDGGWLVKYDCFDHYTSAYELGKLEQIAINVKSKDAE